MINETAQITDEVLNIEIARELLLEINPEISEAEIKGMLVISSNPWDAPILYKMLQAKFPGTLKEFLEGKAFSK
jgi:hypothetical protein